MTRARFLLALAALVASTAPAVAGPHVPPTDPPDDAPGHVRTAPAPVLGAGLPAIAVGGAALVGYRLWRRRQQSFRKK
jgi:hypothetical protein